MKILLLSLSLLSINTFANKLTDELTGYSTSSKITYSIDPTTSYFIRSTSTNKIKSKELFIKDLSKYFSDEFNTGLNCNLYGDYELRHLKPIIYDFKSTKSQYTFIVTGRIQIQPKSCKLVIESTSELSKSKINLILNKLRILNINHILTNNQKSQFVVNKMLPWGITYGNKKIKIKK